MPEERWTEDRWTNVDHYFNHLFVHSDPVLDAALDSSRAAGLPQIQVTPSQGKFLAVLVQATRACKILEIGTLGGYSSIWMARALPEGGKLITLEADPKHAEVARQNHLRAGLGDVIDIRLGKALETLPKLEKEGVGPFDFIFIDADKPATAEYFNWAVRLSRPGTLIITDNIVRQGEVANPKSTEPNVQGVQRFCEALAKEPRAFSTAVQTVGSKGYDGFAICVIT